MRRSWWLAFLIGPMASLAVPGQAMAQNEVRVNLGQTLFYDAPLHRTIGVAGRFHPTPHLAIEPEFDHMYGDEHDTDLTFMLSAIYEFRPGTRIVPYVRGGGGLILHQEQYPGWSQTNAWWMADGGAGVSVFVTERVFVAPEFRIGWPLMARAQVSVGARLGKLTQP